MISHTIPAQNYIPPTTEEIKEFAPTAEPMLMADIINMMSGGETVPLDGIENSIRKELQKNLKPDKDGDYRLTVGGYTKSLAEAVHRNTEACLREHINQMHFLNRLHELPASGATPMRRARNIVEILQQMNGKSGQPGGTMPSFSRCVEQDKNFRKLSDALKQVDEGLRPEDEDLLNPEKQEDVLASSADLRWIDKISRLIERIKCLQLRKITELHPDIDGDEVRRRPMRDFSEISRIPASEWAVRQQSDPLFTYKLATRQLQVRERMSRKEKKQLVFMLVDKSGSMQGEEQYKALGVIFDRMKAVIRGDAHIILSFYDEEMTDPVYIRKEEDAREMIKMMRRIEFDGSYTDTGECMARAIRYINEEMEKDDSFYKPELMVLTDGDDGCIDVNKHLSDNRHSVIVHGLALSCGNHELRAVCRKTGGLYMEM